MANHNKLTSNDDNIIEGYIAGKFLVSTPTINNDPYFSKSIIYMLSHNQHGAIGMIINHPIENFTADLFFEGLEIKYDNSIDLPIHIGGPIDSQKGFVIHTTDYANDVLFKMDPEIAVSSNIPILEAIAKGEGPSNSLIAIGYSGWERGQLELEIMRNSWIIAPFNKKLLFDNIPADEKWKSLVENYHIDDTSFVPKGGNA